MASTKKISSISNAEWEVMKVLWEKGTSATSGEVIAALEGKAAWKPKTIHTLISRLVQKGVVSATRNGREYSFKPLVSEKDCRRVESKSFLDRVFDGELKPFLVSFLDHEELSDVELKELESIVKSYRRK